MIGAAAGRSYSEWRIIVAEEDNERCDRRPVVSTILDISQDDLLPGVLTGALEFYCMPYSHRWFQGHDAILVFDIGIGDMI